MMLKQLEGQTAMVTGSSSGIGQAVAVALGEAGANIIVNYHSHKDGGEVTVQKIKDAGGKAILVKADIAKESDILEMFRQGIAEFGTIDILVNNTGIQKDSPFAEMTVEQWNDVMNTNVTGQFVSSREAVKEFLRRGVIAERSKAAGKIIFISSVHNVIPWAGHANYTASKGAETMLMETMAQELAPKKIRVNSVAPGAIKTNINKKVWSDPEQMKTLLKMVPYQRIGEPEDVAKAVVFLASDDADYITGSTLYVDGGMTLYPEFAYGG